MMMPIGLLLLWFEAYLLSKLLVSPLPERPLVVGRLAAEGAAEGRRERANRNKR